MTPLGSSPPSVCICGHPPADHQPWGERGWQAACCTECGCSIYEQDTDR